MNTEPEAALYVKPAPDTRTSSKLADIIVLSKVRVNALVVATTAGGYYLAKPDPIDLSMLGITCLGTALIASGASALNQVHERDTDKLMERTRHRPVADGRVSPLEGRVIGACLSLAGLAILAAATNLTATTVALATLVSYAAIYTPLKRRTSFSTVIGAVPGALPPLIGWAAVRGSVAGPGPWSLFVLMFLWQLPHFLAIAWIYREDYARAGLPMLTVVDKHGGITGRQTALWAAALIPASQLPFLFKLSSATYAVGAVALGLLQLVLAVNFARHRSITNARRLFLGSIIYLPLLWLLMAMGRP